MYLRAAMLLLIKEEPSYGYDLAARLTSLGIGPLPGHYKVLRALENLGRHQLRLGVLLHRPCPRIYAITPDGEDMLAAFAGRIEDTCRSLQYLNRNADACWRPAQTASSRPSAATGASTHSGQSASSRTPT
jgi:DNA-binding PadR family transcriptional regulator